MNRNDQHTFAAALIDGVWQQNVLIEIDERGMISRIEPDHPSAAGADNVVVPGMPNLHSHAFQRGFAGLSEYPTERHDSFWTWRTLMYDFVDRLTPDDVYIIARQLYLEMLVAGYTWVGEFHYLHHDRQGRRYNQPMEMTEAVLNAATDAGIGICILPVLYQRAGFQSEDLLPGQRRFELTTDEYLQHIDHCRQQVQAHPDSRTMGCAFHSLRAVDISTIQDVLRTVTTDQPTMPRHIHIAEQQREVDDCLACYQRRPVELLFDHVSIDERWCLIHATHLTESEIALIANSKSVVGLCPTTEANLGDGIFPAEAFLIQQGRIGIGSDSHCTVDMRDEMRTLEYGQRLRTQRRAVLADANASAGRRIYETSQRGGRQALGLSTHGTRVGDFANWTIIDPNHAAIAGAQRDRLLDRLVFCHAANPIQGVIIGNRRHDTTSESFREAFDASRQAFVATVQKLTS